MDDPRDGDLVDTRYYEAVRPGGWAQRVLNLARRNIYADFVSTCQPTPLSTILDVGVSDVLNEGANILERMYPCRKRITAVGLGVAHDFKAAFPEVRYRQITANGRLPFEDDSFHIATSNAVLEHVGSVTRQHEFVSDLTRVARAVFITVPNRHFPVEHHTAIPLLHYWRPAFQWACKLLGKEQWSSEQNLILMSRGALSRLAGPNSRIGYTGVKLGPFSSNLFLYIQK
jgi:Methyltransferase domain